MTNPKLRKQRAVIYAITIYAADCPVCDRPIDLGDDDKPRTVTCDCGATVECLSHAEAK